MLECKQFCTFFLNGSFFGIELARVQEVLRYQEMTPVPLAPRSVAGLINLRGQIVMALDMRRRLDFPPREPGVLPMNVVIRNQDGTPVSFLVDEIGEVLEVDEAAHEPTPHTLSAAVRHLIPSAYKLSGCLMLVLDTEAALNVGDRTAGETDSRTGRPHAAKEHKTSH